MRAPWCNPLISLLLVSEVHAFAFFSRLSTRSEKGWWGWAWGAESTVSVVDRSPVVSFPSRPAAFGADITNPILGYVIPLSSFTYPCPSSNDSLTIGKPIPNFGCPKLCTFGDHLPEPSETWIALVQRGKCEFVNKVREAQRLGARAVVVGGQDPDTSGLPDTLINMYSPDDSSDVKISATFIKYADYHHLSDLIAASNTSHSGLLTLSLLITAEYSAWEWYSPIVTFVIILLLPSALTFITLLVHRVRAARQAQRDRAPEDIVRNLPWQVWTGKGWEKHSGSSPVNTTNNVDLERGVPALDSVPSKTPDTDIDLDEGNRQGRSASTSKAASDDDSPSSMGSPPPPEQPWFETQMDCAICLCEFVKGDRVRVLPCHHIFHMDEVDEWLIHRKKLCPVCKADVTRSGEPESGSPGAESTVQPGSSPDTSPSSSPPDERAPLLHHDSLSISYSQSSDTGTTPSS